MLKYEIETFCERVIIKFANSAKLDELKKYIGKRAYVIVLKKQPADFPLLFCSVSNHSCNSGKTHLRRLSGRSMEPQL